MTTPTLTAAADILEAVQTIRRAKAKYGIDVRFRRSPTGRKVAEFYTEQGEFCVAVHGVYALIAGLS